MKTADILQCHHLFPRKMLCEDLLCRNSVLLTYHFPDLGSASDWWCHIRSLLKPIRNVWIVDTS